MNIKTLAFFGWIATINFCCKRDTGDCTPPAIDKVNVFLDNSGSMRGLFYQETQFQANVYDFGNRLGAPDYFGNKVHYFLASDSIRDISVDTFRVSINPTSNAIKGAGTPFDKMLKSILEKTDSNDISVLFTDGIVSGTQADMNSYTTTTKRAYNVDALPKLQTDISTVISHYANYTYSFYTYESDFKPSPKTPYYSFDNTRFDDTSKIYNHFPYYLLIMGKPALVELFKQKMDSRLRQDLQSHLTISKAGSTTPSKDKKCPSENGTPKMRLCTPYRSIGALDMNNVVKIGTIESKQQYNLAFSIDMNGSDITIDSKVDSNSITYSTDISLVKFYMDGVEIKAKKKTVHKPADILANPKIYQNYDSNGRKLDAIKNYTHIIVLEDVSIDYAKLKPNGTVALSFSLQERVDQMTTKDDTKGPKEHKTFGIHALLGGISSGVNPQNVDTVTFTLYCPYSK
jgi:hypothetical protein